MATDEKRSKLVSEPNYRRTKQFSETFLAIEMKKIKLKTNKPLYFGMSILDISKTLMHKFWFDYIKLKYGDRAKLCFTDTDSFVIHIMTEDFFENIYDVVKVWFDISNYDENDKRPVLISMNKKVIGLFKDELGGKVMKEFVALRGKTYAYLMDDGSEKEKAKGTKKCVIKRELMFENYIDSSYNGTVILRPQQRFKSDHNELHTEEVYKAALSSNDNKRLQTFDRITSFPHRKNIFKVCGREMMVVRDLFVKNYADFPFYDEIILQRQR